MTNDELARTLEALHQQLQEHPTLDPPTTASIRTLLDKINHAVNGQSKPKEASTDLRQQLHEMIEQFEGEHPNLTVTLSQISEFLAHIGI